MHEHANMREQTQRAQTEIQSSLFLMPSATTAGILLLYLSLYLVQ